MPEAEEADALMVTNATKRTLRISQRSTIQGTSPCTDLMAAVELSRRLPVELPEAPVWVMAAREGATRCPKTAIKLSVEDRYAAAPSGAPSSTRDILVSVVASMTVTTKAQYVLKDKETTGP